MFAIAPGLDITHSSVTDMTKLKAKVDQVLHVVCSKYGYYLASAWVHMPVLSNSRYHRACQLVTIGCTSFVLLFDDIPESLNTK